MSHTSFSRAINFTNRWCLLCCFCGVLTAGVGFAQQATSSTPNAPQQAPAAPVIEEWGDDFNGETLDTQKWERFTFQGGSGGKTEVKNGQLNQRSFAETRAGVRSKKVFKTDRFYVEGTVAKVGAGFPVPGERNAPLGFATLTILFDGSGNNRLEWILTSENTLQAWAIINGRGERLDNGRLGTKIKNPHLGIARRGDEIFYMLSDGIEQPQVALQKTIAGLPTSFTVMLYGFGSSENNWDAVRVQTAKQ